MDDQRQKISYVQDKEKENKATLQNC